MIEYELASIADPRWSEAGKVHDWRNYISTDVRAMWSTFTELQKCALYRQADAIASREEWE